MALLRAVLSRLAAEPAISAGAAAIVVSIAAHVGLALTVDQVVTFDAAVIAVAAFVVRQLVTPTSKAPK